MSWLFFIDESGHDHRQMPYEVRGGTALHVGRLWPFIRAMKQLELNAFGAPLSHYKKEIKGSTLIDRKRFRWARQQESMSAEERMKHSRAFLRKGLENKPPTFEEFSAYGQASLEMAQGIFQLLDDQGAVLFASAIPRGVEKVTGSGMDEFLRKDHVFLFERFYYHLESKQEHGLLIMDEMERKEDRNFVRRMENYFTKTNVGRYRSKWVVPAPFFVSSEMTDAVQAADLCIYALNWGFRLPQFGMNAPTRSEIAELFGDWLGRLQFRGEGYRDGSVFDSFGIVYVADPYQARA